MATLAVAVATVLAPSAAPARPLAGTHCCYVMAVAAAGEYKIDYGKDLKYQKTGTYRASWGWFTMTVAAYGPDGLTLRGPGLRYAHFSESDDVSDVLTKTDPPYEPYSVPEKCTPFRETTSDVFFAYTKVPPVSRAKFAQLDTDFKVSPGQGVSGWGPRCAQVDGPASHGLSAYLPQTLPIGVRSVKRDLASEEGFSIGCWQAVSKVDPNPTPHVFTGEVRVRVSFGFFPFGKLDDVEDGLDDLVGKKGKVVVNNIGNMTDDVQQAQKKGGSDHDCGT
jgi:hypothetical protein